MNALSKLFGRHAAALSSVLCALCAVLMSASAARAQSLSFTSAPSTLGVETNAEIWLRADLPPGIYQNVVVELSFPSTSVFPYARYISSTGNPDFAFTSSTTSNVLTLKWTKAGTLDLSAGASNRQFLAVFKLDRYGTKDATPFEFRGRLTGTKDGIAMSVPDATATVTSTVTSNLSASMYTNSGPNVQNPTVADGHPDRYGVLRTYNFRIDNPTQAHVGPIEATVTLPPGLRFHSIAGIQAFGITLPGGVTSSDAPAPWVQQSSPVTFHITTGTPFWGYGSVYTDLTVKVFIPCSALPFAASPTHTVSATISTYTANYAGVQTPSTFSLSASNLSVASACGQGGGLGLTPYGVSQSGERHNWSYSFAPPTGASLLTDVMYVWELPPETTSHNLTGIAGLTYASCNMTGQSFASGNTTFTYAEFLAVQGTACHASFTAGDTHVVHHAASVGGAEYGGFQGYKDTYVASSWPDAHGTSVALRTYLTFRTPDGTLFSGPPTWDKTGSQSLPTTSVPMANFWTFDGRTVLDSTGGVNGSGHFHVSAGWGGLAPRNSVLTVNVPDGVTINSLAWYSDPNTPPARCRPPAESLVWPAVTDRPLVFRLGTDAHPWTPPGDCTAGPHIRVTFAIDPSYPFFHDQTLSFTGTHAAANQTGAAGTGQHNVKVIVAAGQDSRLTVVCGDDGDPVFTALAVNRGRDPIADGVLHFVVPEDSTVTSVTPNAEVAGSGGGIEVSTDGGLTWLADPGVYSAVTNVRLAGIAIAGGSASNLPPQPGFSVSVSPFFGLGTIEGEVTMSSPGLGTTTPKIAPFEVGLCPGSVEVDVFFDADGDMIQDVDEPSVGAGHQVKLVPQAGSPSGFETDVETTGAGGSVTFEGVTPGAYDIVYVSSPATAGQWSVTHASPVTLANDGTATGVLGLGCGCEDPSPDNVCSDAECNAAGACVTTWAELDSPCDDGIDDGECSRDVCQSEGFCGPTPLAFGTTCTNPAPDNICYAGGQCDGGGTCEPVYAADGTLCGPGTECAGFHCAEGECLEEPLTGEPCTDPTPGDPCTSGVCDDTGACAPVEANEGTMCADPDADNPCDSGECRAGECVAVADNEGGACADPNGDDPCTVGECSEGACVSVADNEGGTCADPDPDNPCTAGECQAGLCAPVDANEGGVCADPDPDNPCDGGECNAGSCMRVEINEGMTCPDSDPANPCDAAQCQSGTCTQIFVNEGGACEDPDPDNPCNAGQCQSGACMQVDANEGGTCADPDPENPCDTGECRTGSCVSVPDNEGGTCDDPTPEDPCTEGRCDAGACIGANADDGTACTLDDLCVDGAECQGGSCTSTGETDCDDADDCTVDSCDSVDGCVNEEPACDAVAIAIPLADAETGAAAGHVLCYVTPSPTGGPGTLTCDSGSGVLVQHDGAGVCGSP